jgi:FkbM family methyltransferase
MSLKRFLSAFSHLSRFPEALRCLKTTHGGAGVLAAYLGLKKLAYPAELSFRNGDKLRIDSWEDLTTCWAIYFHDEYPIKPDDQTIVDLGGNIGAFAVWVARLRPAARVFAFEPFPQTFDHMNHNITRNGLNKQIQMLAVAVGASDGQIEFDARPDTASHSRKMATAPGADTSQTVTVPMLSLESMYQKIGLQEVDAIKSNVEGAEYEIFGKAPDQTLRRMKRLLLEYHRGDAPGLFRKIESAGFKVAYHKPQQKKFIIFERV